MSDESMHRVCSRIYDSPHFAPRHWHFNQDGTRKPNPYRGVKQSGDLNKLTIKQFEASVLKTGLTIRRKQVNPFSGTRFKLIKRLLAKSPIPDFFCASVVYELEKTCLALATCGYEKDTLHASNPTKSEF
jgi:hypothetical protein